MEIIFKKKDSEKLNVTKRNYSLIFVIENSIS